MTKVASVGLREVSRGQVPFGLGSSAGSTSAQMGWASGQRGWNRQPLGHPGRRARQRPTCAEVVVGDAVRSRGAGSDSGARSARVVGGLVRGWPTLGRRDARSGSVADAFADRSSSAAGPGTAFRVEPARLQGDHARAHKLIEASVALCRELDNSIGLSMALANWSSDHVRPDHLEVVTPRVNTDRRRVKYTPFPRKLSESEYARLFELRDSGWSQPRLAREFGITQSRVSQILIAHGRRRVPRWGSSLRRPHARTVIHGMPTSNTARLVPGVARATFVSLHGAADVKRRHESADKERITARTVEVASTAGVAAIAIACLAAQEGYASADVTREELAARM